MRKIINSIFTLIFLFIGFNAHAANTINADGDVINITIVDSDFDPATYFPGGVPIQSIDYIPAATDEICIIKNGSDTGPIIFKCTVADGYDDRTKDFHGKVLKPYFDYSASTNSADGLIIIILAD